LQSGAVDASERDRVRQLIDEHYAFIWRLLARLGIRADDVDDATQQVFMVLLTRERLKIQPGSERAFLFGIAVRVAREQRRRNEKAKTHSDVDFESIVHPGLDLEALADQQRARELLDRLIQSIPEELRMIFILFEIEGLPAIEVAALLDIPAGTVASRLRRARQHFREAVKQMNIPGALRGLR
jgi:RNA polymerase sigma-70 factor (ECF subfamily)